MATDHNFRVKNGLEVGGVLIVNSSGALQVSPSTISSTLTLSDDVQLRFGNDNDLKIFHDSTNSINYIQSFTSNELRLESNGNTTIRTNNGDNMAVFTKDGGVSLYNDNNEKLRTITHGITVYSPHGNATIGAQNTSGFHIYTERDRFYFNKITSHISNSITSYDGDFNLQRQEATKLTLTSTGASVTGNLDVSGDLNITGDINSVSVTDLDVVDKTITVGQGQTASNSTGSGLIVSGANAQMLWHETNDRFEFNKDINAPKIDIGNSRLYPSGDNNHLHFDVPTAIIGSSTSTASNPSIGTSAYRFNGVYSGLGSFSGDMTIAGTTLINGANDNAGKADFAVNAGGSPQISWNGNQIQAGGTDMNWSGKILHDGTFRMAAWNSDIQFFSQNSNTGSSPSRDMYWSPQISGTGVPTERMRLKGDTGRLGIGTNAPAGNLHIKSFNNVGDALLIVEADNDNNIEGDNPRIELRQDGANVTGYLYLEGVGGSTATGTTDNALVLDSKGAASAQGIQFAVSGRAAAQSGGETNSTVAMTILGSNRNVGIGHTAPSEKLHIHDGSIYVTPVSYAANQDDWALKIGAHNHAGWDFAGIKLRVNGSGGPRMSLMGVGQLEAMSVVGQNIGISEIAPADKLHIGAGNILLDNNLELRQKDTGGNIRTITRVNSSNQLQYGWSANGPILFMGGGSYTERMRIHNTNGHVSIGGNTSPTYKLVVSNGNAAGIEFGPEYSTDSNLIQHYDRTASAYMDVNHIAQNHRFGRASNEWMRISNTGNVGINENNPQYKLHIEETGVNSGAIFATDGTSWLRVVPNLGAGGFNGLSLAGDIGLIFSIDGDPSPAHATNGLLIAPHHNVAGGIKIMEDGDVGIGNNAPSAKLHVQGIIKSDSTNPQVRIHTTSGTGTGYLVFGDSADDDVGQIYYSHVNEEMAFKVGTDTKMIIKSNNSIVLGNRILDFNDDGGVSTQPQFIGDRSTTDLNSRAFTNEGGFSYTTFDSTTSNKPSHSSNNANGLITLNSHNGSYNHQLAFTNLGNIAHRKRDGGGFSSWYNLITDAAPNAPSITSTTVVNETIEIVFAASTSANQDTATSYEVWSDGGTGDFSLIARIPYNDIASSMSVIDSSFDDSGTIAYRVYAIKHGVYSTAATTTRSFNMPALDVSTMSVVPDTNSFKIQYNLPNTRFLDHVEIYMDAEASSSNLARSGASLVYSGKNPSYCYSISNSDMAKYHQFWVECVSV